jgi:hypothetical protein
MRGGKRGLRGIGPPSSGDAMKIRAHSESHIVELDDDSRWQIFPGDLDVTLNWKPETEIDVVATEGDVGSHALVSAGGVVRVIRAGESWPVGE